MTKFNISNQHTSPVYNYVDLDTPFEELTVAQKYWVFESYHGMCSGCRAKLHRSEGFEKAFLAYQSILGS